MKKINFVFLSLLSVTLLTTPSYASFQNEEIELPVYQKRLKEGFQFPFQVYKNYLFSIFSEKDKYSNLGKFEEAKQCIPSIVFFKGHTFEEVKRIDLDASYTFYLRNHAIKDDILFIVSSHNYTGKNYLNFIDFITGKRKAAPIFLGDNNMGTSDSSIKFMNNFIFIERREYGSPEDINSSPILSSLLAIDISQVFEGR
jgi:hypothetical protein